MTQIFWVGFSAEHALGRRHGFSAWHGRNQDRSPAADKKLLVENALYTAASFRAANGAFAQARYTPGTPTSKNRCNL
jgi:hypothetical protein